MKSFLITILLILGTYSAIAACSESTQCHPLFGVLAGVSFTAYTFILLECK